jgi:hypothetical protein
MSSPTPKLENSAEFGDSFPYGRFERLEVTHE